MRRSRLLNTVLAFVAVSMVLVVAPVAAEVEVIDIDRVSVSSAGAQGDNGSYTPGISSDAAILTFDSDASNLVAGDTNGASDVFVYDVASGVTERVSVSTGGAPGNGDSYFPVISGDGTTIAYFSLASTLVAGDTNGESDVFVHDRSTGATSRVSVATAGTQGDSGSYDPALSGDGDEVVFDSEATNLVAGDTNDVSDVFVHDVGTGATERVSVATGGTQADSDSFAPAISGDGSTVSYYSFASNLVAGDTNGESDVFMYDLDTGVTSLVSVASDGSGADAGSFDPSLSDDGNMIAFVSDASNLVEGDTNAVSDVFVYDVVADSLSLVSIASDGSQANNHSFAPVISGDGTAVIFESDASNLVVGDTNAASDLFVHELASGATSRVSVAADGTESDNDSLAPVISGDGAFVAYYSFATNLVTGDTNAATDVFLSRLNRSPVVEGSTMTVPEDAPVGTVVGTVTASDPEGDPLSYAITGGDPDSLFTVAADGVVTTAGSLDYETTSQHVLTVTVSDGSVSSPATVTVNVTDVDDTDPTPPDPDPPPPTLPPLPPPDPDYNPFDDDDGSVFENDIEWLALTGITSGCGTRLFCPADSVSRGQMAAFLTRALSLPEATQDYFTDDEKSIFEDEINRLAQSGITSGCTPTTFCPGNRVTRAQMAAFLVRAFGYTDDGGGDLFDDDNNSVFESDIDKLAVAGVTLGCNPPINNNFCPGNDVTRAQMAAFLRRAFEG